MTSCLALKQYKEVYQASRKKGSAGRRGLGVDEVDVADRWPRMGEEDRQNLTKAAKIL